MLLASLRIRRKTYLWYVLISPYILNPTRFSRFSSVLPWEFLAKCKGESMKSRFVLIVAILTLTPMLLQAQVVQVRPTAYTPTCDPNCGGVGYYNPTYAYDNNQTTAATASVIWGPDPSATTYQYEAWGGFPAGNGATPITLKVTSYAEVQGTIAPRVRISYSLNNGSTWTEIYALRPSGGGDTVRNLTTDAVTLPNTQDLTQVVVKAEAASSTNGWAYSEVHEIWIEEGS